MRNRTLKYSKYLAVTCCLSLIISFQGTAQTRKNTAVTDSGIEGHNIIVTDDFSDISLSTDRADPLHQETVTINTETGEVTSESGKSASMKDVFDLSRKEEKELLSDEARENKEKIIDHLEEEGLCQVEESDQEDELTVTFPFVYKRIIVSAPEGSLTEFYGASQIFYYTSSGDYILDYSTEEEARDAYDSLVKRHGADNVMPDIPIHACSERFTETESYSVSWGNDMMHLDKVRDNINANPFVTDTVTVAVLDSGINKDHEIYSDRLVQGAYFVEDTIDDGHGHGSHLAGIIADGTPKQVRILPVKILDSSGYGELYGLIQGINYAVENKADIINLSLGVSLKKVSTVKSTPLFSQIETVLKKAYDQNILFLAAAGNYNYNIDPDEMEFYPAVSPYTIAVSGIANDKSRYVRSNYGNAVDFTGPAVQILSADGTGTDQYKLKTGTSQAVPHVASACAVLKLFNKNSSTSSIMNMLKDMAVDLGDPGKDIYFGNGLIVFPDDYGTVDPDTIPDNSEDGSTSTGDEGSEGNSGSTGDEGSEGGSGSTGNEGSEGGSGSTGNEGSEGGSGSTGNEGSGGGSASAPAEASETQPVIVKGKNYRSAGQTYKVIRAATAKSAGTVIFIKAQNAKSVIVPDTVKLEDKKTYKVTVVNSKAFTGKKIRTVTIGRNIKKIRKYAFASSKAVKLILKTRLLKKAAVKDSLKGSKVKKIQVKTGSKKMNMKCIKTYKKIFTKKNAGVKASIE